MEFTDVQTRVPMRFLFTFEYRQKLNVDLLDLNNFIPVFLRLQHLWGHIAIISTTDDLDPRAERSAFSFLVKSVPSPHFITWLEHYPPTGSPLRRENPLTLFISKIKFGSPLEIEAHNSSPHLPASRLKTIANAVMKLLAIDLVREKVRWDVEISRQKAIEAALKNAERTFTLGKKIKDPDLREEFVRSFAKAINEMDGISFKLTHIDIEGKEQSEQSRETA